MQESSFFLLKDNVQCLFYKSFGRNLKSSRMSKGRKLLKAGGYL